MAEEEEEEVGDRIEEKGSDGQEVVPALLYSGSSLLCDACATTSESMLLQQTSRVIFCDPPRVPPTISDIEAGRYTGLEIWPTGGD